LANQYQEALRIEIAGWMAATPHRPLRNVYFGGGSPGMLPGLVATCLETLSSRLESTTAIGLELHPLDVRGSLLADLREMGVNRISLGIESFSSEILHALGRGYSPSQAREALDRVCAAGFECVDVNLIYGLGTRTPEEFLEEARTCVEAGAHQVSAYPLISFHHTRPTWVPDLFTHWNRDRSHRQLRDLCHELGLRQTSVWSFAKPGIEPYSTVTLDTYRGFGAGAATRTEGAFWFHTFDVAAYLAPEGARPALALVGDDRFFRAHWLYWKIYGLRIPGAAYAQQFGSSPEQDFPRLFRWMRLLGLARRDGQDWAITSWGADWIHRVQQLFSLSWIDLFWSACMKEAWPKEIKLT